jgi:hypothetical protein
MVSFNFVIIFLNKITGVIPFGKSLMKLYITFILKAIKKNIIT